MRVVVTGAAGFIGSHLVDALVARGDEVIGIDDLSAGSETNLPGGFDLQRLDVRSPEAACLVRERRPDTICHLAAQKSVSRSTREPVRDAEVNIVGTVNLLQAAADAGSRFVFASTGGALYGDTDQLPTPETYPAWPISPYGVSKLAAEHYLHSFALRLGMSCVALRYGNVYGPRQDPHGEAGVVAIFSRAFLENRAPTIHGAGTDTRDYVYVGDVVRANVAAIDRGERGHFNVGTGRQTDTNTICRMISESLGIHTEPTHGPPRAGDLRASALDATSIRERLGWRAQVTLEEGIRETTAWFRERFEQGL